MGTLRVYTMGGEFNLDSAVVSQLTDETGRILKEVLDVYKIADDDPVLNAAAFKITVNYVAKVLGINKKTAELLVASAIEGESHKGGSDAIQKVERGSKSELRKDDF